MRCCIVDCNVECVCPYHWNDTFVQKDKQRILLSSACLQPRTMADFARRWELDIARVRDEAVMREL